jgi:hypothetical protein
MGIYKGYILTWFIVFGARLFSCGTSKEGESYLVEWNESDRAIKQMYSGLQSRSSELAKFDTTKNRFLAVGDDYQIKSWDMDNINIFSTTSAEGCLPVKRYFLWKLSFEQFKSGYVIEFTSFETDFVFNFF